MTVWEKLEYDTKRLEEIAMERERLLEMYFEYDLARYEEEVENHVLF